MIRRLLSWLSTSTLEQRLAAYRALPTGLPGEAEARRRAAAGQIGPHPCSGEAVGRSEAREVSQARPTLSPVLARPDGWDEWNRDATARAMRGAVR